MNKTNEAEGPEESGSSDAPVLQDWIIEDFVIEANARKGDFLELTLLVDGLIVSGILTGITEYYQSVVNVFHKEETDPEPNTWGAHFKELVATATQSIDDNEETTSVSYIHLRDARIYTPGQKPLPSNQGIWWRGRIAKVSAFWIGRLRNSESFD